MPEGDTIFRTAVRLRETIEGQRVTQARSREPQVAAERIAGHDIRSIEARGKHLLIHFSNDCTLHSHMGMTGSWHLYGVGERWQKPEPRAAVILETPQAVAVCFSPKLIELLTAAQLRAHRYLRRLGPDLLGQTLDVAEVLRRFRVHDATPIGEAVMNQSIACGVGNVYKSEVLFLLHLDPFLPVRRLSDEKLTELIELSRTLLQKNLGGHMRRTRFGLDRQRLWVYGRSGKPCLRCATPIQVRRQGEQGRTTYWCPTCQA